MVVNYGMIHEVGPNAREIGHNGDVVLCKVLDWANAREHENLVQSQEQNQGSLFSKDILEVYGSRPL